MSAIKNNYNHQSPTKILFRAQQYSKTIENRLELPKEVSKSFVVKTKAQKQLEDIDYAIQMSEYQQELFRYKQNADIQARNKLRDRFQLTHKKIVSNIEQLSKKKVKKGQEYEKHVKQVFKRYTEEQRQKRMNEKQQAEKLRQELQQFYEKEKERKIQNEKRQVKVGTCYQSAVERINQIHRQNEMYARKAQQQLEKNLRKNNKLYERVSKKRRLVSECNSRKPAVYHQSLDIAESKKRKYIQTCAKNEEDYIAAWQKIGKTVSQWRKKREETHKKDIEKWRENKHRVDEANATVSEKCLGILDKTSRATYRKTASTFRSSVNKFQDIVQQNKQEIREQDEFKKDEIMDMHIDLTLRNISSARVSQKMKSMRQHARKLAYDFL